MKFELLKSWQMAAEDSIISATSDACFSVGQLVSTCHVDTGRPVLPLSLTVTLTNLTRQMWAT